MKNTNQNQYLLKVQLGHDFTFRKTFKSYDAMKDYIKARDFYFVNADYTTYDLAIQVK